MRIIGGTYGGRTLRVPKGLPARPTTDRAKEALFNMLSHRIDWEDTAVLDLFTGTGNIAIECASRGAREVIAVERDYKSTAALKQTVADWRISSLKVIKAEVKRFLKGKVQPFDLIFLDPPYQWDGVSELIQTLMDQGWLAEDGLLIAEHQSSRVLDSLQGWEETRAYGDSSFSFFSRDGKEV